jgi:hypothetical protein
VLSIWGTTRLLRDVGTLAMAIDNAQRGVDYVTHIFAAYISLLFFILLVIFKVKSSDS